MQVYMITKIYVIYILQTSLCLKPENIFPKLSMNYRSIHSFCTSLNFDKSERAVVLGAVEISVVWRKYISCKLTSGRR